MKLDRFLKERDARWDELGRAVARAKGRPERLGAEGVLRLGDLYRSAAADLALARRSWPGDPVVARLEALVGQARHLVYDAPAKRGSLLSFFGRRYWRIIAERPVPVIVAWLLLLLPALLGALWAAHDPAAASGVLPAKFQGPLRTSAGDLGQPVTLQASLAAQIFTNNIQVTFLAFATGIAAGLGTALVLVYNGLTTGVIAALAWKGGSGSAFGQLVVAHGVLELSAIVVAAAAGMRMGWALIDPGRRRRRDALGDEAGRAVQVVLGTIPWLVLAGLVEGFITPAGFGLRVNTLIGLSLGVVFWSLVLIRGRATSALDSSP